MSLSSYETRYIVPSAEYWGTLAGEDAGYLVVGTSNRPPTADNIGVASFMPCFIEEVGRIRVSRAVTPVLEEDDLAELITHGVSLDPEVPTSGHFYAASVQLPEFDDSGDMVVKPVSDYQFHAYVRLGDTTRADDPEAFDIAEVAIDSRTPHLPEAFKPLLGSVLRPPMQVFADRHNTSPIRVYTDIPSELGSLTMQSFGFKPLENYGFEGYPEEVLGKLAFLGSDHLADY